MNEKETLDLDRVHTLMMTVLDNECTEAERRELHDWITRRPELAAEWSRLRRVKEVTGTMALRQPPAEIWDRYRVSVLHRAERGIAWLLIAVGAALVGGWALWHWFESLLGDTGLPLLVRSGIVALAAGAVILVLSVVRERLFLHRSDPYSREVTR